MAEPGVPVAAHLDRILALVAPLPPVVVPLAEALGLVSAADVAAPADLPRFDHAAMDGYAVRAADVSAPVELPVLGVVAAGDVTRPVLAPGTALRIMTGAPVPAGADAVVPFEWTDRGVDRVVVSRPVTAGRHVRRSGEDVAAGDVVVTAGAALAAAHLALLAGVGIDSLAVRPAPRVAVVATGAELAVAGRAAEPGQVADSNTVAICAAAQAAGARATIFGPVPDDPAVLVGRLTAAAEDADLVVTTGGVSAGDHDVVKAALRDREGFWFGGVAVKPGRPQGCGTVVASDGRRVPVVCLPGTPVAAYCSFRLFAEPALHALAGRPARSRRAVLDAPVEVAADRATVLPAAFVAPGRVAQLPGHVGHSQRLLAAADVLLVVPPGGAPLPAGSEVEILSLGERA
ncbi:gephyrin-like molybdotransferase Glp [Nocardioides sp. MH1]|uniref:molybdopterin molybdotransferase MoeA n=1 Tax=Nocardioides sp. MH1 TaxID=3242490 RepID=UPI00351FF849